MMDNGEKLFGQGGFLRALIVLIPIHYLLEFLLEKVQSEVLFGFEVIEQGALSNFGPLGNGFGGGVVKAFLGEKSQRGFENGLAGLLLILDALPARRGGARGVGDGRLHSRSMSALIFRAWCAAGNLSKAK